VRRIARDVGVDLRVDELLDLRERGVRAVGVEDVRPCLEHVRERQQRRALARRKAAADQHGRVVVQVREKLADEPALADARVAEQGHQRRPPVRRDAIELGAQRIELTLAADERRRQARHAAPLHRFPLAGDEPRAHRSGLAPQAERLVDFAEHEMRARRACRPLTDDDRPGLGGLLEPRGDVDRVAGHE
jgi:hypothetical protein